VISLDALNAWRPGHPWADDEQVEQDLIMTRVAIEIASHPELRDRLVWRGGTCLHKLFLPAALRYSEDLDYVAYDLSIEANDMRTIRTGLREVAERIGLEVSEHPKTTRIRLTERFAYTSLGDTNRRIKVEINLDDVPPIEPLDRRQLAATTDWWRGEAGVLTFQPVELIATKFRALAQRSKGRDLSDLDLAHRLLDLNDERLAHAAAHYLLHAGVHPNMFRARLAAHLADPAFTADVGVYLVDPTTAGDPGTLVNQWILWADRHLDLAYAALALEREPSKRKERMVEDIGQRLAAGQSQCPIHSHDDGWVRCPHPLDVASACPVHGAITYG
jgi:predicted nucleotidyltransferase component of viral defense system